MAKVPKKIRERSEGRRSMAMFSESIEKFPFEGDQRQNAGTTSYSRLLRFRDSCPHSSTFSLAAWRWLPLNS